MGLLGLIHVADITTLRSGPKDKWETMTVAGLKVVVMAAASVTVSSSMVSGFSKETNNELIMVVSRNSEDLVEVIKELDDYFLLEVTIFGDFLIIVKHVTKS